MLRLFTPQEARDRNSQQLARDVSRTQEVKEALKKSELALAKSEAEFSAMIAGQKEKWAQEEVAHETRLREMEIDVKALEKRRSNALIPIEIEREKAQNILHEARKLSDSTKEKEIELDIKSEALEKRLDEVAERELRVSDDERKLELKKQSIQSQQETTNQNTRALSEAIQKFNEYIGSESNKINESKKAIFLREQSLEAKDNILKEKEEGLRIKEIQLDDQRKTLERELNRTKNGNNNLSHTSN